MHHRALPGVVSGAMYVGVIGISEDYRGMRMPDGETRIGDFLLNEALKQQERVWGATEYMWAFVHKDNGPSQDIFRRAGFQKLPLSLNPVEDVWARSPNLPVPDEPPVE